MIPKPIHEIGLDDLQALLDNGVQESKTIEYKLELPGNADKEKARFLAFSLSALPGKITAERVARAIFRTIRKRRNEIIVPYFRPQVLYH